MEVFIDTVLHSAVGDLEIILKHYGVVDTLVKRAGGEEDNFIKTGLSDAANLDISNGTSPFTGRYKPSGGFSCFGSWNDPVKHRRPEFNIPAW